MSLFAMAMLGLGLFLVLYTIAFLLRPAKEGAGAKKDSLGCGFVLLAGLVWSLALANYLGERGAGFRLGFGGALLLPALVTIFRPGRKRIVHAAVLFVMAVMLASSAFPKLKKRMSPGTAVSRLEEMRTVAQTAGSRVELAKGLMKELDADRAKLVSSIKAKKAGDFNDASKDAEVMRMLKELAEIDHLKARTREKLKTDRSALERIESAIRRAERLEKAGELTGETVSETELSAIIEDARSPADSDIPSSVETHLERAQLEDLYGDVVGE
jgi:hypothetical protein